MISLDINKMSTEFFWNRKLFRDYVATPSTRPATSFIDDASTPVSQMFRG